MALFDPNHPYLRHLWVRVGIVFAAAAWAAFEFISGNPFWGIIFLAAAAICFHAFFLAPDDRPPKEKPKSE